MSTEYGWLVERPEDVGAVWLCFDDGGQPEWTTDADRAIRLQRKEDADSLIAMMHYMEWFDLDGVFSTDHCWEDGV